MKKLAIVLGTRPEIIKLSSVLRAVKKQRINFTLIHTNQHYSPQLDKVFFDELELPSPHHNLEIGSGKQGEQTAKMIMALEQVYEIEQPEVVIVQGDTNSVLAGALTASKMEIQIAHVEAGLRSFDRSMPEETNRILTDHISDFLFAPTEDSAEQLRKENISDNMIFQVGNTVVDAVYQNSSLSNEKSNILEALNIQEGDYFVLTVHRAENTNNIERLKGIFKGIELVYQKYGKKIVYPIHPRTKKVIETEGIKLPIGINLTEPLGYLDFLKLLVNAGLIMTDSGGLQEEGCILKVPCVTLRDNTERPQTLEVGSNILAGADPDTILKSVEHMYKKERVWANPFGDGKSGERILDILIKHA